MGRRFYRSRRSNRKRSGALSTKRIYSRTGAKAQANQIYALRRSVSKIKRRLRPEIYTHHLEDVITKTFTNSSFGASYWSSHYTWPTNGTGDENKRGDKIWCRNMQLNFTFEYHNNSNTAYHSGESSGCPVRVIMLKSKTPVAATDPDISDILLYSNYTGGEYTQRAVSPYVHGITDKYRLLYNKVFYINPTKNQKVLRIFLRPGLIQWQSSSIATHVFMFVCPCGLHSDADFTESIEMTMSGKIAYNDF